MHYLSCQTALLLWFPVISSKLCTQPSLIYSSGFPGGSDGKEFTSNAGDPGSTPMFRSSSGEGNGYPLQYSCLENSMDRIPWQVIVHGIAELDMTKQLTLHCLISYIQTVRKNKKVLMTFFFLNLISSSQRQTCRPFLLMLPRVPLLSHHLTSILAPLEFM